MAPELAIATITPAEHALHTILLNKDEQALCHLRDHYEEILYGHIYHIVHEEIKTSVALCETFKKIWLLLGTCEPGQSGLLGWMLQIAETCALSWEQEIRQYKATQTHAKQDA